MRANRGRVPYTVHGGRRWFRLDQLELIVHAQVARSTLKVCESTAPGARGNEDWRLLQEVLKHVTASGGLPPRKTRADAGQALRCGMSMTAASPPSCSRILASTSSGTMPSRSVISGRRTHSAGKLPMRFSAMPVL